MSFTDLKFKKKQLANYLERLHNVITKTKMEDNDKFEVLKMLSRNEHHLTDGDLKVLIKIKSKNEKKYIKLKENNEKVLQNFERYKDLKDLKQPIIDYGFKTNKVKLEEYWAKKVFPIILTINKSTKRNLIKYNNEARIYKLHKNSWSLFTKDIKDRLRQLKDYSHSLDSMLELEKIKYLQRINDNDYFRKVIHDKYCLKAQESEVCYNLLTWMSPLKWKQKFNIDNEKLKYDIIHCDTKNDEECKYFCNKSDKELLIYSTQLLPKCKMYWTSAEQVINHLKMIENINYNQRMVSEMINKSYQQKKIFHQ